MTNNPLGKINFEDYAWKNAEYPRLQMKDSEIFKHTEIQNFESVEKNISFGIGYHHGRRLWYLDFYTHEGIRCEAITKLFSSIPKIKDFIREKYNKEPILPKRWN